VGNLILKTIKGFEGTAEDASHNSIGKCHHNVSAILQRHVERAFQFNWMLLLQFF
jgi:hypothetical protein